MSRDNQYLNNVNYLILSPQSNIPLVREYVSNNGFKIIDEGLVEDDKIYTVIKCQKGQQVLDQKELYFGPILVNNKDSLFMNLYSKRLDEIHQLLNKNLSIERINQLTEEVNLIKEVLNEKFADIVATKDKGKIMKAVMAELKGKADGKVISSVVADICK